MKGNMSNGRIAQVFGHTFQVSFNQTGLTIRLLFVPFHAVYTCTCINCLFLAIGLIKCERGSH